MQKFEKYKVQSDKALDKAIDRTAFAVQKDAQSRLQGMFGSKRHIVFARLMRDIYLRTFGKFEKRVGSNVEYAPYIEFGTGDLVFTNFNFSPEAKVAAAEFKGRGIRKINIHGDSFLNWAAVNQTPKHRERIIEELNKIKT